MLSSSTGNAGGQTFLRIDAVKAKTGTYFWYDVLNGRTLLTSKSLAGTLTTARGRRLTFAMFVNNVPLPPGVTPTREARVLGQLCEIIHQHAPPPRE